MSWSIAVAAQAPVQPQPLRTSQTLKYLYLLFDPDDAIYRHGKYVFTTEAHPLPMTLGSPAADRRERAAVARATTSDSFDDAVALAQFGAAGEEGEETEEDESGIWDRAGAGGPLADDALVGSCVWPSLKNSLGFFGDSPRGAKTLTAIEQVRQISRRLVGSEAACGA